MLGISPCVEVFWPQASVVSQKFVALVFALPGLPRVPEKQVPFDYAQGRLSAPLKYASFRMTGLFLISTLEAGR
jgi:hypothetical protein